MTRTLPYAHGGPVITAALRVEPDDFRVEEVRGFEPTGEGEHSFLSVEKTGANTEWVAHRLAKAAGVAPREVGFAGLKDRHAVTRQTFTVRMPGRGQPDWSTVAIPGVRVMTATRHDRKLKRGAHRGNRFRIRLRNVQGACDAIVSMLDTLCKRGVPNYFGEQRFGRAGENLALATALFSGLQMTRANRGHALSAARSEVFNAVLASRVANRTWDQALDGEVFMLDGTHSIFGPTSCSPELVERVLTLDIHPTGPMWGRGASHGRGVVAALEQGVRELHSSLTEGLEQAGLEQARRALRVRVHDLVHAWQANGDLEIGFELGAGAFATAALREVCVWR